MIHWLLNEREMMDAVFLWCMVSVVTSKNGDNKEGIMKRLP